MSTSHPSKALIALTLAVLVGGLIWLARDSAPNGPSPERQPSVALIKKQVPKDFVRTQAPLGKASITDGAVETFSKIEQAKPNVSHRVHAFKGEVVAEEYLFERGISGHLLDDALVKRAVPANATWSPSQLKVLDWRSMKLQTVPLLKTRYEGHVAALYESGGVARLVICNELTKEITLNDLVVDATMPDKGIQDALKQIDSELPKQ